MRKIFSYLIDCLTELVFQDIETDFRKMENENYYETYANNNNPKRKYQ